MKETVLLVDPLSFCRRELREVLEALGYQVVGEAASLGEAWDLWESLSPQVVILELLLPDGDGLELVRRARRRGEKVRFIVLSAACGEAEIRAAARLGVEDFLAKPLDPERLKLALEGKRCSA